jgi:hypothetical protein
LGSGGQTKPNHFLLTGTQMNLLPVLFFIRSSIVLHVPTHVPTFKISKTNDWLSAAGSFFCRFLSSSRSKNSNPVEAKKVFCCKKEERQKSKSLNPTFS